MEISGDIPFIVVHTVTVWGIALEQNFDETTHLALSFRQSFLIIDHNHLNEPHTCLLVVCYMFYLSNV